MNFVVRPFRLAVVAMLYVLIIPGCGRSDPAAMIVSAKAYLDKHNYSAATIQLKNALQKTPDNAEVRFLLGVSLLESGNPVVAEIELRKALKLGLTADEVQLMLARSLQEQGAIGKLSTEFGEKTLSSNAAQAELLGTIGHAQLNAGNMTGAREAFELALTKDSQNPSARLGMARLAAIDNRLPEAFKMVEEVLSASPDNYRGQMLMGDLQAAQNRIGEAENAYRAALSAAPARLPPRTSLVALLVRAGQTEKADAEVKALAKMAPGDPRTAYSQALVLIAQKNLPEAKKSLAQVLKAAPDDVPSLLLAGIVAFDTHAYLEAESYFRKVVEKAPNALYPRRLLAASRLQIGQTERALSDIQKLLAIAPNDPDVLALAGEAYLASGNVDQATRYYERLKSVKPDNSAVRTRLGLIMAATGDTARAIKELEAAAASDANSADADLALISTYLRQGESDKALDAIAALERKRPDSPISHNLRGLAYSQKRDTSKARASFEKSLAVEPTYFPAAQNLAQMDLQDKKKEDAQKRFKDILAKDPNHEQALLSLAGLLAGERKYEEARSFIDKAIAAHPESVTSRIALVRLQALQRDPKAALDAAQTAHNALPDNLLLLRMLGIAQQASGDFAQAIATFQRLAAAEPKAAEPQVRLAGAFLAAKRNDGAVRALQRALELDPEQSEVQRDLARLYAMTGRIDEALAQGRKLQKTAAQSPVGYVIEADILIVRKDLTGAESAVRRGIDKTHSPALIVRLHSILLAQTRQDEANALISRWLRDHPGDLTVSLYLAESDINRGAFKSALKRYEQITAGQPDNAMLLNNMAWAAAQLKDERALEYAQKAYELAPENAAILDTYGMILMDRGELDKGVDLLSKAITLAPQAQDIRLNLAKALAKAGRKEDARRQVDAMGELPDGSPLKKETEDLKQKL